MRLLLKLDDGGRRRQRELDAFVGLALGQFLPRGVAVLSNVLHEERCRMPHGARWCHCREILIVVTDSAISSEVRQ